MVDETIIGKIYSIACKDFITYDDVIMFPGKYLNIIIGPNGTGKSTLVAAIILGLGGHAKLLSRSAKIQDYIKNGKTSAWMEIKIYKNAEENLISFERTIDSNGKSSWKVDGTNSSPKDYLMHVDKYKVQINNLCQFLPQDRVQDFAKMNPQEILISTMSSVCSPDKLEQFENLKELRKTALNSKNVLKSHYSNLMRYESIASQLKEKLDKIDLRNNLQNDLKIGNIKKCWLNYLNENNKTEVIKMERDQAVQIVDRNEKEYEDIKKKSLEIIKDINNFQGLVETEGAKIEKCSKKLSDLCEERDQLANSIRTASTNLENKKIEIQERDKELENELKILRGLEQDLKNAIDDCDEGGDCKTKIDQLNEQLIYFKNEIKTPMDNYHAINRKIDDFTPEIQLYKRKIESLKSVDDRKLNVLRDNFEDVYKAVIWLRQNLDMFEGKIYEPMFLELNVKNLNYAKYIENSVSSRDLLAFTCESKADMNVLVGKLCSEMGLQINVLHSDPSPVCQFQPKEDIEIYRKYGFFSYLINMIEGPAPILNYLCKVNGLDQILAGSNEVCNYIDVLPKHLLNYFAGNYHYSITISKYSGDQSSMRTEISNKKFLSVGIDQKELDMCTLKLKKIVRESDVLKNKRIELENKIKDFEEKRSVILNEKNLIERKKYTVQTKKDRAEFQKRKTENLKNKVINIEKEEEDFKKFAANVVNKVIKVETKKVECLKEYLNAIRIYEINKLKLVLIKSENSELEINVQNAKERRQKSNDLLNIINKTLENAYQNVKKYLHDIKDLCNGTIPNDKNFIYKKDFKKLPDDLEELNNFIYEIQSRVDCIVQENDNIITEYQGVCKDIEEIHASIATVNIDEEAINKQILTLHNTWYPEIMKNVDIINTNFGNFMASMEYVGEIQLGRKEEFDYDSYGIEIFVQYRNKMQLQALDRFVQSGGERAVAIAVYTLALQHITNVPFRCVDEINQGMDPRNERKFFEMLVNEAAKPKQSQYFFVTPKLLPNLPYNDYMTFHIVFNGPHIANKNVFNVN